MSKTTSASKIKMKSFDELFGTNENLGQESVGGEIREMFFRTLGAQMTIYFMTMLFAVFMARSRKAEFQIPFERPKVKTLLQSVGISVCGIPIALVLSALAAFLSSAGADSSEDITKYPIWLATIAFAIVPAVVEEYVFRGLILGAYMNVDMKAAVFISSLFFALLHFSLGSVLYGFFYGCVFALIRIATGNMVYSMVMHLLFNAINVAVSYAGTIMIPGWFMVGAFVVGIVGFIVLCIFFFQKESCGDQGELLQRQTAHNKRGIYNHGNVPLRNRNVTYDVKDSIGLIDLHLMAAPVAVGCFLVIRDATQ